MGAERAAVMCRQGCGWWGEGWLLCGVCVRCEWMRGSRKGGGSGERQVVATCVGGLMAVTDGSRRAQATQCVCLYEWGYVRSRQGDGEWRVISVGQRGCCCLFVGVVCDDCDVCVRCVCEGSVSDNRIGDDGASALAPHLGGLTALQTLM